MIAADSKLIGLRCPQCLARLHELPHGLRCGGCGQAYDSGPYPGTILLSDVGANFSQELDREIETRLIPGLDLLEAPACSEREILRHGHELGHDIGNPVCEGRADLARLMPQADGVVLDLGCGYGTNTIALARSARHVFALDRSVGRVALTAARARAEGLQNITGVHASATTLPLAAESCDLVMVVGVLEWTGVGSADPIETQREVLREIERVLRPGGRLVLGIENRFGAHYFAGAREEHTGLRFVSLLPRPWARLYSRLVRRVPLETYTHSRRALEGLLDDAGLTARIAYTAPSYQWPQLTFDQADASAGLSFYFNQIFHYSSTKRRLAARLCRALPLSLVKLVFPSFWAIAEKGRSPAATPTVVLGRPDCHGQIKAIEWRRGILTRRDRLTGRLSAPEAVLPGQNARRWTGAPLRADTRRNRQSTLLAAISEQLRIRPQVPATDVVRADCREQAHRGLAALEPRPPDAVTGWCRRSIDTAADLPGVQAGPEHGDLTMSNIVVGPQGDVRLIDNPSEPQVAIAGRDSVTVVIDLLSSRSGCKTPNPDVALDRLLELPPAGAADVLALLGVELDCKQPSSAASLIVVAVLRHCAEREPWDGTSRFVARAAAGELREALQRLSEDLVPAIGHANGTTA